MARTKGSPAAAATQEDRGEAYEPPTETEPQQATAQVIEEAEVVPHAIVPRGSTAVTTLADVQELMLADSEEEVGFEKGDVALPFMRVLQSNSPQVKRQNAKYILDAEAGNFYNTATNRVYDGDRGIYVVPVYFTKQATLWTPRGEGGTGGFVAELPVADALEVLKLCTKNEKKKDITPLNLKGPAGSFNPEWGGKELSIAALYYLLVMEDLDDAGNFEPVAYPFTSTQWKKARSWNAIMQNSRLPHPSGAGSYKAPKFGFVYHLTTIPESNALGDWMGVRIKQNVPLLKHVDGTPVESFPGAANLYLAARDFKQAVDEGKVKVKAEEGYDDVEVGGEASGPQPGKKEEDDDLPF